MDTGLAAENEGLRATGAKAGLVEDDFEEAMIHLDPGLGAHGAGDDVTILRDAGLCRRYLPAPDALGNDRMIVRELPYRAPRDKVAT